MIVIAVLAAALAAAAFVMLLPGIVINTLRGRYKARKRNLVLEALRDPQTWAISSTDCDHLLLGVSGRWRIYSCTINDACVSSALGRVACG
jgi:hypothetical protein